MVAGGAAVVMKIDAVGDGRLDEAQHLVALMVERFAIIPGRLAHAEVDAEARAERFYAGNDAVLLEHAVKPGAQLVGHGEDLIIETGLAVRSHSRQSRRHHHGMTVISAA